jgi:RND family efflux transporter MFP subunit
MAMHVGDGAATADSHRRIAVDVHVVTDASETGGRTVPALVSADGVAIVLAKRDGTLVHVAGDEGASVSEGEVMAQLDDGDSRFQLEQARLESQRAEVEAQQADAAVRAERLEYNRQLALFKYGLVSRRDVDQARHRFETARRDIEKHRLAVQMANARVRAEDERTNIRSPFAGILTRRYARLGNSIQRGDKLFEVTRSGALQVRFDLADTVGGPGPDIGTSVELLDASGGRVLGEARIHAVRAADPALASRTYLAEVPRGGALRAGMALAVRLPGTREAPPLAAIPRTAFPADSSLVEGQSATIYVISSDGICRARTVQVEAVVDDRVQISSGVTPGERIVLAPPSEVWPGTSVEVLRETKGY